MKLSDIFEADVVDFAARRKEKDFINRVGDMQQANDPRAVAQDIGASEGRDAALAQEVMTKYGRDFRAMRDFLQRPVMSGGFKSAYDLNEALYQWRRKGASEKVKRSIQKAATDDRLYNQVQQANALWNAISDHYPMEVIWALPSEVIDDFEVLEDLTNNLGAARRHFMGK